MLPEENRLLLMTTAGACARLGVSRATLNRWVKEGKLACVRLSENPKSHRRFTLGALEDLVASVKPQGGFLD